jgi:replication fork protection complex subunit Tof1/Swi1
MLEKYSKNKSYMFVRKRRAARHKRKAAGAREGSTAIAEDYGDEDEEAALLEADKDMPSYAEHAFTFQSFEKVNQCQRHLG